MSSLPRPAFDRETAVAIIAGVAAVATSYAFAGRTPGFVVTPVERFLSRAMPGEIVAFAITTLGSLGQELNLLLATTLLAGAFALVVRLALWAQRKLGGGATVLSVVLTGVLSVLLGAGILQAAVIASIVAIVIGLDAFAAAFHAHDPLSNKRRRALTAIGGTAGLATVGYQIGRYTTPSATSADAPTLSGSNVDPEAIDRRLEEAADAAIDEADVAPLVSDEFYNVDINAVDPNLAAEEWELSITGAVETERTYSYEDIQSYSTENRFATLRCVGESLNGHKMDNALWTGVPVADLLAEAGPHSDCECVMLRAADGYYEEFPLPALEPGLLAYGMNGNVLPRSHGYPLRALVPGHWGEVNVKWLTEIEVLEREAVGYWEKNGWHGTGPVVPVAKLHTETDHPEGRLLGGHAYGGTRGVSAVEVSTDDGETWNRARLSDRLPDDDVWRQWAYTYDPPEERHTVVVRMIDDDGTLQPEERRDAYPDGPSGWVMSSYSG